MQQHPFYQSRQKRSIFLNNLQGYSPEQLFPLCLSILRQNPDLRKSEEINILRSATQNIKFFQTMLQEQGEQVLNNCLKQLTLEFGIENTFVFEKGDRGDKFFIILSGQVGVYVFNNQAMIDQKSAKLKPKINNLIATGKNSEQIHKQHIKNILEQQVKVNQLSQGDSFGEMSLINDAPRLASIICEKYCTFGVLSKKDYKDILQNDQERKIQTQITELQQCIGFQNLSRRLLTILLYAFKSVNYTFREIIYKQNQRCQQEIYLIQHGEFIISQKIQSHLSLKVATLQKGSIFGDLESFQNLDRRTQSVQCNSESGKVLCIEVNTLLKRLQGSNEMHLYEELKKTCEAKEISRKKRYSMIDNLDMSTPSRIQTDWNQRCSLKEEYNQFSEGGLNTVQKIDDIVQNKLKIFKKLYKESSKDLKNERLFDFPIPPRSAPKVRNQSIQSRSAIQRILNNSNISKRTQQDLRSHCYSFMQQKNIQYLN